MNGHIPREAMLVDLKRKNVPMEQEKKREGGT